jgi:hypothetical protein
MHPYSAGYHRADTPQQVNTADKQDNTADTHPVTGRVMQRQNIIRHLRSDIAQGEEEAYEFSKLGPI